MAKRIFVIFAFAFLLYSCAPPRHRESAYSPYIEKSKMATHTYELTVKDINGQVVNGAEVVYTLEKDNVKYYNGNFITKSDGKMVVDIAKKDKPISDEVRFSSQVSYKITKEGYYAKSGAISVTFASDKTTATSAILLKPIDYINPSFLLSSRGNELKQNILRFIDIIRLQSLLANAELKPQTIDLVTFKEKHYLQLTFVSSTTFNSLKLNKYDIGKQLFDDVVRKVLTPLNEHISNPTMFYGYDLKLIGYTKNFAETYSASTAIEYRFMIPGAVVKKYKNKDISGQSVLDSSIILMDDERIELKLQ